MMNQSKSYIRFQIIGTFLIAVTMFTGCLDFSKRSEPKQSIEYSLASIIQTAAQGEKIELGFEQMLGEIKAFVTTTQNRMQASNNWLKGIQPDNSWFDLSNYTLAPDFSHPNKFIPFVEKIMLPQDSSVAVWGDLHGSVGMLSKSLQLLQQEGYFDATFTIAKSNFYLIFIGDFVDHQPHGLETLFIATKLYNQNPGKVFLLRGNHEDAAFNTVFRKELAQKFKNIDPARRNTLYALYEYLPLALFAGIKQNNDLTNYVQFCHAGFELGYSARDLLQSSAQFEQITHLNRSSMIAAMPDSSTKKILIDRQQLMSRVLNTCDVELEDKLISAAKHEQITTHEYHWLLVEFFTLWHRREISQSLPFLFQDITINPTSSMAKMRIGLSWSSFGDDDNNHRLKKDDVDVLWAWSIMNFGPQATQEFLRLNSADNHRILSVVRGHQHQGRMLELLKQGKGIVNLWNGKVITTVASPEYTGYASFNKINFAINPEDWYIDHHFALPGNGFEQQRLSFYTR